MDDRIIFTFSSSLAFVFPISPVAQMSMKSPSQSQGLSAMFSQPMNRKSSVWPTLSPDPKKLKCEYSWATEELPEW